MEQFNNTVLKIIIAKVAQSVGFDSVTTTSLDVLTTLLNKYLTLLGTRTKLGAELRCSAEADISDVLFMMESLKITTTDIVDYMQQMESVDAVKIKNYPASSSVNLGFTYPNTEDQVEREEHIPLHYPPLVLHSKPEEAKEKKQEADEKTRRTSFVIAGRHGDEDSSDDNGFGMLSNDGEESDASSRSVDESRLLIKPEDIPVHAEGTAPSSKFRDVEYYGEYDDNLLSPDVKVKKEVTRTSSQQSFPSSSKTSPISEADKRSEHNWLLGSDTQNKSQKTSGEVSTSKTSSKSNRESTQLHRTPSYYKSKDLLKSNDENSLKAKIEAAEKLIHNAPSFLSASSSQMDVSVPSPKTPKTSSQPSTSSYQSAKSKLVGSPESTLLKQLKNSSQAFASPKSMDDAISAVISRASEEAKKAEEEAELMKFSHLVDSSSSAESEPDVLKKEEEILQLTSRGLNEATPASKAMDVSDMDSDGSYAPSKPTIPIKKEKRSPVHIYTSSSEEDNLVIDSKPSPSPPPIILPPKKVVEKHTYPKPPKKADRSKQVYETKPLFFPEDTSTIIKVKKKKHKTPTPQPKSSSKNITKTSTPSSTPASLHKVKPSKTPKPDMPVHTPKEKLKVKIKEHKKHKHTASPHVEKLVLKKGKGGSAEVIKKEDVNSPDSPPLVSPRSNLPLPKLSAAIPVLNVGVTPSSEKEKKKSKKEKKKQKKDKHGEKERKHSSSKYNFDTPSPKPDVVPKLTLYMGSNTKSFVVKKENSPEVGFPTKAPPSHKSKSLVPEFSAAPVPSPTPIKRQVITQTISSGPVVDEKGNKIWICPSCNEPDDGSPMIGCDTCDDWYHWPCVGITCEPPENEDWYCPRCMRKRNLAKLKSKPPKKKRKKTIEY